MADLARVLVVDDEKILAELMALQIKTAGYQVHIAHSGNEALAFLKSNPVDIVVSDIRMPNGDGIQLLKEVRKLHPSEPVVGLVTGFADCTEEEVVALGGKFLMQKPLDFAVLFQNLKSLTQIAS